MSSWSGAMIRHARPPSAAEARLTAASRRHRYDHVGLPWRARIVPSGSMPSACRDASVSRTWKSWGPSAVCAVTIRDHAGSHSGRRGSRCRPCRVPHGFLYHSISVMAVLSPDPTPMQRIRSPRWSVSTSRLSVIGRDAGPTLPSSG